MRTALKFVLLFFIFSILFVLPYAFFPLQAKVENPSPYNPLMLLLVLLTQVSVILYLIKRLDLWGMKLFLAVMIVFWGLQTFMTQIETWYFREAMPSITNQELIKLFLNPLITSLTFIPVAMWILGKWKEDQNYSEPQNRAYLTWKEMVSLSLVYVIIYFVFGYYVAWQFEELRVFYSGSAEDVGFVSQIKQMLQTRSFIFLFQFFRGFLWIIIGLPVVLYLKGNKREKIVACLILYSIPVIQLTLDNPFMPQPVRIAHFLEVASSNGLFGLLIGYTSTRK